MGQLDAEAHAVGEADRAEPSRAAVAARRRYAMVIALLTLVPLGSGLVRLGTDGLWRDELFSAYIATRSLGHAWSILLTREINMGLYYLLLWAWTSVSDSEFWIRAFSLLAAAASVPVTAAIARRLFGPRVAVVSALLMSVSPFLLFYGRFARSYALTVLLVSLSGLCLLRALDRPELRRRWVAYVLASVVMVLSTPLTLLVVAAHAVALLAKRPASPRLPALIAVYAVIAVLVAPVMAVLLLRQGVMSDWIPPLSLGRLLGAASDLSGAPLLVPVYGLGALAWLIAIGRRSDVGSRDRLAVPFLTAWLVLPVTVLVAVSVVKPLIVGRYFAPVFPAMVLVLAWALCRIPGRRLAPGVLVAVLALSAGCEVNRVFLTPEPEDLRGAAQDVDRHARPGDVILYGPNHLREGVGWYLDRAAAGQVVPKDVAVRRTPAEVGDEFAVEYPPAELARRVQQYHRVWVVTLPDGWHPTPESGQVVIDDTVRPDRHLVYQRAHGLVIVQLYDDGAAG